ncbi:MAG TPA: TolC family protein, partial [Magnetospirillum sp.]|nr:TolC family protein [Magnetospirillum sp.]
LGVTVPIYQNGAEYSRVRAQKEVAAQRRLETDQARVDAVQSAGKAWNYLDRARRTEAFYLQQVAHNIEAVDGVQEEEQIGSRTVIEVLNAKQELVTARVNLIQARHDLWLASFQLRSVMGNLTAEALALPVAVYDPAAHYEDVRGKMFGTGDTPLE